MLSQKHIKATKDYCTFKKPVNAPYIRKTFELECVPETARITLTCTGFYRLWVNGTEITNGRLAPYISNPDRMMFYDTYDVVSMLNKGKNCIALILGNGISNALGGYVWQFDTALYRSAPRLALYFEAKCGEDTVSFEADDSFKCAPSPIYFDDFRCGEFYDANLEIDEWNTADFDDSEWTDAIPTETVRGKVLENDTDRIVITKELKPVKVYEGRIYPVLSEQKYDKRSADKAKDAFYKPDENETGFVFEFSENSSCVPRLRIKGKKGQKIVLQFAEYCNEKGDVSFENLQHYLPYGFCQRDIYICKGEGVEEYVPSFTYHGARYCIVLGADKEQISEDTVTMLVMNSDIAERGNFSCSDEIANALQNNARISDLANFVYFPTDCPHREKNGWTGDAAVSAEHMTQNLAVEKSLRQWLKMVCDMQREDGAFPGIIPSTGTWGYAWGDGHGPAWDQVIIEIPYQTYIYRGDTTMFKEASVSIIRYIDFLSKHVREDGLIRIGLGDWCHALRREGGSHNHLCPNEVSDSIICYNFCRKSEFMFNVCGMKHQADFAKSLGDSLYEAVRERLIDFDTMTVYSSCQCAQAMALYYGIFETGEIPAAYNRLIELVHEADDHFDCGMIGVRTMFRVLANHGDGELAYKMITRTDAPSYGIWIKEFGLASMAESFHTTVDGITTSLNHHFMSDISGFFIAHIAGLQINPHKNNPAFVRVSPTFISTLDHAEAYYDTTGGKVSVKWEREEELIKLTVNKDEGVSGEIILPKGYRFVSRAGERDIIMGGRSVYTLLNSEYIIKKTV